MKYLTLLFGILLFYSTNLKCQSLPVAVDDYAIYHSGSEADTINILRNDYHPDGLPLDFAWYTGGILNANVKKYGDSCIIYSNNNIISAFDTIEYTIMELWNIQHLAYGKLIIRNVPSNNTTSPNNILDVNNLRAKVFNNGFLFSDPYTQNDPVKLEYPANSSMNTIYTASPWIGCKGNGDSIFLSANSYGNFGMDFTPGPICKPTVYDTLSESYYSRWDNLWKVTKQEIENHIKNFNNSDYTMPQNIKNWPAHGKKKYGHAAQLAPFIDLNNDSIYQPELGEYPDICGEQAIYFIFIDEDNHSATQGSSFPLGIEVHGMIFGFDSESEAFNNSFFVRYRFFNRSEKTYDSVYLGQFIDFDLGDYPDDYIGCDVQRGSFYAYNGHQTDYIYGENPPAQAVCILEGPKMNEDSIDNPSYKPNTGENAGYAINGFGFGDGIIDNETIGMSNFMHFIQSGGSLGNPNTAEEYINMLQSKWKSGEPLSYGGNGYIDKSISLACRFAFPKDSDPHNWGTNGISPAYSIPWDEISSGNTPRDTRGVGSMGPFTFEANSCEEITLAFVSARNEQQSWPEGSLNTMNAYIDEIRNYYFENPNIHDWTIGIEPQIKIAEEEMVTVYPNPATDHIHIKGLGNLKAHSYKIVNLMGETIQQGKISESVNISKLEKGLYIFQIYTSDKTFKALKFIKK